MYMYYQWCLAYREPPSTRLSAMARRRVESRSTTPHVACSTESSRQSPAVRFQSGYSRLPSSSTSSVLQLMMVEVSSGEEGGRGLCNDSGCFQPGLSKQEISHTFLNVSIHNLIQYPFLNGRAELANGCVVKLYKNKQICTLIFSNQN